jgi:hypothetical protein
MQRGRTLDSANSKEITKTRVTMDQLWTLATTWYPDAPQPGEGGSTRLQEDSRRPQPDEMRLIFAGLGLGDDFWDPQSDSFG